MHFYAKTFKQVYPQLVQHIADEGVLIDDTFEIFGSLGFTLEKPQFDYIVAVKPEDVSFMEAFSAAIVSGKPYVARAFDTEKVKSFANPKLPDGLPDNFSVHYGVRLAQSKEYTIRQLKTRRAVQQILIPDDALIADCPDSNAEYACTQSLHWRLHNDYLNLHVHMRSSNVYRILPIDVYNFVSYMRHMANETHSNIGKFSMSIGSAHVFLRDLK